MSIFGTMHPASNATVVLQASPALKPPQMHGVSTTCTTPSAAPSIPETSSGTLRTKDESLLDWRIRLHEDETVRGGKNEGEQQRRGRGGVGTRSGCRKPHSHIKGTRVHTLLHIDHQSHGKAVARSSWLPNCVTCRGINTPTQDASTDTSVHEPTACLLHSSDRGDHLSLDLGLLSRQLIQTR